MKVTFIRHGMTYGNTLHQYIGATDQPLCDEGIKELEKIEMIRHPDGTYGLYSGATSTQKSILKVFGIDTNYLKHLVTKLSVVLRETEGGNQ